MGTHETLPQPKCLSATLYRTSRHFSIAACAAAPTVRRIIPALDLQPESGNRAERVEWWPEQQSMRRAMPSALAKVLEQATKKLMNW